MPSQHSLPLGLMTVLSTTDGGKTYRTHKVKEKKLYNQVGSKQVLRFGMHKAAMVILINSISVGYLCYSDHNY